MTATLSHANVPRVSRLCSEPWGRQGLGYSPGTTQPQRFPHASILPSGRKESFTATPLGPRKTQSLMRPDRCFFMTRERSLRAHGTLEMGLLSHGHLSKEYTSASPLRLTHFGMVQGHRD